MLELEKQGLIYAPKGKVPQIKLKFCNLIKHTHHFQIGGIKYFYKVLCNIYFNIKKIINITYKFHFCD